MRFLFFLILFLPKVLYADLKSVGNYELNILIKRGVNIIDVRTPEEWKKTGIINNSLLISLVNKKNKFVEMGQPWADTYGKTSLEHFGKLNLGKPIICRMMIEMIVKRIE